MKLNWILVAVAELIALLFLSRKSKAQQPKPHISQPPPVQPSSPDEPTIGSYYGEVIPIIIAVDADDYAPDLVKFDTGLNTLLKKFNETYPYKWLQVKLVRTTGRITDWGSFQQELRNLAKDMDVMIPQMFPAPENTTLMLFIWCPYWRDGAELASIQKVGKYIYSYALMRSSLGEHFPNPLKQVGHELGHLLGLTGDGYHTIKVVGRATDPFQLSRETVSDYIWGDDREVWFAEDEKIAISNKLFNDGQVSHTYLFGCRNGMRIPWHHKYKYTNTPHEEYSATWDEVIPFLPGINSGQYINKNPCT